MHALGSTLTGTRSVVSAMPRRQRRLSLQARALRVAWIASLTVAMVCAAILLAGYSAGYERLYQPWADGPSTHPFTALALALLALGTLYRRPFQKSWLSTAAFLVALSIGATRMADIMWGWHILDGIALFPDVLARHRLTGSPITFGGNTAIAIVAAGIAGLSQTIGRPMLSQFLALVALAPPLVSVVGHSYGLLAFYGEMSIYTTLILLVVCIDILLSTAHRAIVRMVLNNYTAGRMARHLLLVIMIIPFAGGMFVVRTSDLNDDVPVALLVVFVALGNAAVALRTLIEVEKLDRTRRQLERSARFEASHDQLTKLANRRFFESVATHEFARSQRCGSKLSILMFDIDHFKKVNDKFGHQFGDRVLAAVAHTLSRTCREMDLIGRYGGEEFVALLPGTNMDAALQCAERLRTAVNSESFQDEAGNFFSVTVSAGVAEKNSTDCKFEDVVNRADRAMYAAKAAGRNHTCTDG
jgi:diguanylate cyclase (GGDEF)-like protein